MSSFVAFCVGRGQRSVDLYARSYEGASDRGEGPGSGSDRPDRVPTSYMAKLPARGIGRGGSEPASVKPPKDVDYTGRMTAGPEWPAKRGWESPSGELSKSQPRSQGGSGGGRAREHP